MQNNLAWLQTYKESIGKGIQICVFLIGINILYLGDKKNLMQRSLGYNSERERFNFKGIYIVLCYMGV